MGWMLDILTGGETGDFDVAKSRQDAQRLAGENEVRATLSWIARASVIRRAISRPASSGVGGVAARTVRSVVVSSTVSWYQPRASLSTRSAFAIIPQSNLYSS